MFVHFTINHIKYYLRKIINSALKIAFFLFLWGFKVRTQMCFMVWKFGNLALEKFCKYAWSSLCENWMQISMFDYCLTLISMSGAIFPDFATVIGFLVVARSFFNPEDARRMKMSHNEIMEVRLQSMFSVTSSAYSQAALLSWLN